MNDILNNPFGTLSHQSGHEIWATFPFPLFVSFMGFGVWGFFLNIWYCMNRDGCTFIWRVLLIQCFYFSADHLPLERSGHPSFKFRNHYCFIWLCYLHPLYKLFWLWDSVFGGEMPVSQFCFMYWLLKLSFGIKIKLVLSLRGNFSEVTKFSLKCSHLRHLTTNPLLSLRFWPTSLNHFSNVSTG